MSKQSWDAVDTTVFEFNGVRLHRFARAAIRAPVFCMRGLISGARGTNTRIILRIPWSHEGAQTVVLAGAGFRLYTEDLWGITASDRARYAVWGRSPAMGALMAAWSRARRASLPFLPEETVRC